MPDIKKPQGQGDSNSSLVSKNVTVDGRRTSIRLEPEMWLALNEISLRERCTMHDLCDLVYKRKDKKSSLTAAIRVFLMLYYRAATTEEGHIKAGHGNFDAMRSRALKKQTGKAKEHNVILKDGYYEESQIAKSRDYSMRDRKFTQNLFQGPKQSQSYESNV